MTPLEELLKRCDPDKHDWDKLPHTVGDAYDDKLYSLCVGKTRFKLAARRVGQVYDRVVLEVCLAPEDAPHVINSVNLTSNSDVTALQNHARSIERQVELTRLRALVLEIDNNK